MALLSLVVSNIDKVIKTPSNYYDPSAIFSRDERENVKVGRLEHIIHQNAGFFMAILNSSLILR